MICRDRGLVPARAALFAIALFACAAADVHAANRAIHKCVDADGKTVFSDAPCAGEAPHDDDAQSTAVDSGKSPPGGAAAADAARKDGPPAANAAPSCATWMPPDGEVAVDPPRKIDPNELPHDASGRPVEILVTKQRGPMTVAAACSAMVSACSQKSPDPGKSIDICFKSAPRCATAKPWEEDKACCPTACWQKYAELRGQCVDASTASYKALFEARCVADEGASRAEASVSPTPAR